MPPTKFKSQENLLQNLKKWPNLKVQKGLSAQSQLNSFTNSFAKMAVEQYRGEVKGRKALDKNFSGQTFISKDSSAKKIALCMGILNSKIFFDSYMEVLSL